MSNKRIFYATQAVILNSVLVEGVQSVGVNTSVGKRLIKDLGKADPISILESKPTVEVSLERIIASASDIIFPSSGGDLLADATHAAEYDMLLLVGEESRDQIDTLNASTQAELSLTYLQISSVSYEFNVSGPVSESITFTGHNKDWSTTRTFASTGELGYTHSANVSKREDYSIASSIIPSEVQGALQSISISFDLSRREILDLGKRQGVSSVAEVNQYKLLDLPVEITTTLDTVVAVKDFSSNINAQSFTNTPSSEQIKVVLNAAGSNITFDMGSENALEDISRSGGDAGGGNVEASYTYKNYNTFSIS